MTSETSPYPQAPPPPPATGPSATAPLATGGWSGGDAAIGGALVVLLIALFLPWFSSTAHLAGRAGRLSGGADGPHAHGFLWAVFVLAIVGLIVVVTRDAIGRAPGNLPSPEQMLVGTTGLALLLTVLGLVIRPSTGLSVGSPTGQIAQLLPHISISTGWSYGGFVAVAAALVGFLAALAAAGRLEPAHRAVRATLRRPGTAA